MPTRSVGKTIEVAELPHCDICIGAMLGQRNIAADSPEPIRYDSATTYGAWANLCPRHWKSIGVGIATRCLPKDSQ